jgi:hypothetical protein
MINAANPRTRNFILIIIVFMILCATIRAENCSLLGIVPLLRVGFRIASRGLRPFLRSLVP